MELTYYISETERFIKIDNKPDENTVFFSDDFDLALDWAFGLVPYAKDQECNGQCDDCICYLEDDNNLDPAGGTGLESHR